MPIRVNFPIGSNILSVNTHTVRVQRTVCVLKHPKCIQCVTGTSLETVISGVEVTIKAIFAAAHRITPFDFHSWCYKVHHMPAMCITLLAQPICCVSPHTTSPSVTVLETGLMWHAWLFFSQCMAKIKFESGKSKTVQQGWEIRVLATNLVVFFIMHKKACGPFGSWHGVGIVSPLRTQINVMHIYMCIVASGRRRDCCHRTAPAPTSLDRELQKMREISVQNLSVHIGSEVW